MLGLAAHLYTQITARTPARLYKQQGRDLGAELTGRMTGDMRGSLVGYKPWSLCIGRSRPRRWQLGQDLRAGLLMCQALWLAKRRAVCIVDKEGCITWHISGAKGAGAKTLFPSAVHLEERLTVSQSVS